MKSQNGLYELEILVHGRPVQEYQYRNKVLLEGRKGSEYKIHIRNCSGERVAVVLSVDGLSVMNGKNASKSDRAYIVGPFGSVEIPGWRLDDAAVASFLFGTIPESYAAKLDKPDNVGVIGAAFYHEKPKVPAYVESRSYGNETYGGGMKGVGTGFGREQQHHVHSVDFDRQPYPAETLTLHYDDAAGLEARGIILAIPHKESDPVLEATAFPADGQGCKPPVGW